MKTAPILFSKKKYNDTSRKVTNVKIQKIGMKSHSAYSIILLVKCPLIKKFKNNTKINDVKHSPKAIWREFKFDGQYFSINTALKAYDKGTIIETINHKFNELLIFPSTISEIPINPDKVPKINLKFTFKSLNCHTIKRVKTGTLETIKVKIPASIFGATKNSIERGAM